MTATKSDDWSPADNPYAIAVSEAQWWRDAARLAILRMRDGDDRRLGWFSSRQIDARYLVLALRQLLAAEQLEQIALRELGIDAAVRDALADARQRFVAALPGIMDMRDGLIHFEDWSRGQGRGPQQKRRKSGELPREVARKYWGFGYNPNESTVSLGPYTINIDIADRAAVELARAIYMAAHEVDKTNVAELRARTVGALASAGISCGSSGISLRISPGIDLKIWLSFDMEPNADRSGYQDLAARVFAALSSSGLSLVWPPDPLSQNIVELFARGELLYVRVVMP